MSIFERIEFDEDKRRRVMETRGVDLLRAAMVLAGPILVREDGRNDYGEVRYVATGEAAGDYYTIVYTTRGTTVRIITAWRAGRSARRQYQEHVGGGAV
jgi:uncharacterized DUF497 family protein